MRTDNNRIFDHDELNYTNENQSYVDQYQQEHIGDENNFEEEQFLNEDQNYLDNEFSNALDRDDFEEDDFEDDDLDEEDLDEEEDLDAEDLDDDLEEDYDENDREPKTFAADAFKID